MELKENGKTQITRLVTMTLEGEVRKVRVIDSFRTFYSVTEGPRQREPLPGTLSNIITEQDT